MFGLMTPAKLYLKGLIEIAAHPQKPRTFAILACDDPAAFGDAKETPGNSPN